LQLAVSPVCPRIQKKYSVCQITSSATIVNGEPREGGLADLRLGSADRFVVCTTDGMDVEEGCPGYFGHIELAEPLYHIGFNRTVLKVLRCVGYHSSKLLLDPNNTKDAAVLGMLQKTVMGPARLDRAMQACQGKKMDFNAGAPQPKYKMDPAQRIAIKAEFPAPKANDMEEDGQQQKIEREQVLFAFMLSGMPAARPGVSPEKFAC
jgi:DNA-directed RNA polymerase II subunit RPB1